MKTNLRVLIASLILVGLSSVSVSAQSPVQRANRAYESARERFTIRPSRETTVRPSTSGIEIERRDRRSSSHAESHTRVEIGRVRPWGDQSSDRNRREGWGIAIGSHW
jgi:hypothetical protein